jgi:diacylglycerol kinase
MTGTFIQSFGYAFRGLAEAWRSERNFRVQCCYAIVTAAILVWLRPQPASALLVFLAMSALLSAELMNSALERVVDLSASGFHPLARTAKDLAASSVLVIAFATAVINLWVIGGLLVSPAQWLLALFVGAMLAWRFAGGEGR